MADKRKLPQGVFRRPESKNLWIAYDGRRESVGSPGLEDAKRLLSIRKSQAIQGTLGVVDLKNVSFEDLAELLVGDYRANDKKNLKRVMGIVGRLWDFFGKDKAVAITTEKVNSFIAFRKGQTTRTGRTPTNATINRELSALKRMFSLGQKADRVLKVPYIPKLAENNAREGFFEQDEFTLIKGALPASLRLLATAAYYTGMRAGELLDLQWPAIDLIDGRISLAPGDTKNGQGRTVFMSPELLEGMRAQKDDLDRNHPGCPWVFHRTGKRIKSYKEGWATACRRVGLEGKMFHDLRRTAVRNMVRAGVPEIVAMRVSGHRTRSVFDRYNIVSEGDLARAAQLVGSFHGAEKGGTLEKAEGIVAAAQGQDE